MTTGRITALVMVAVVVAAVLTWRGSDEEDGYMSRVVLTDAGGLRKGANVRVGGAPAGRVTSLELDPEDRAVAELRLEEGVAPLGAGARALVQADGFFGERYIELSRGDATRPVASGTTIPIERSGTSVRLDDVVDALDTDTRSALRVFLREQGTALVGREKSLGQVLRALPPGLARTGDLLDAFAADNRALGALVDRSDRVVGSVARERDQLGRMLAGAGNTLDALASRRAALGETVRRAPATLRQARATLVALQRTTVPLVPAARGLRATAPSLTATLRALPAFTEDAVPTLRAIAELSPELQRLATQGRGPVRRLRPLADDLTTYTQQALGPFTDLLVKGTPNLFGVMEGWARATQGRDGASQIFRFGATTGTDTFAALLETAQPRRTPAARPAPRRPGRPSAPSAGSQGPSAPKPGLPKGPKVDLPDVPLVDLDKIEALPNGLLEQLPGRLGNRGAGG